SRLLGLDGARPHAAVRPSRGPGRSLPVAAAPVRGGELERGAAVPRGPSLATPPPGRPHAIQAAAPVRRRLPSRRRRLPARTLGATRPAATPHGSMATTPTM